jgi:hypothetical protein
MTENDGESVDCSESRSVAAAASEKETAPMLDVHAPHEPVHTWKSFFIHIATIVIGLLIAHVRCARQARIHSKAAELRGHGVQA